MRIPLFVASRFRPAFVFPMLRAIQNIPILHHIVSLYDPGIISRHISYQFEPKHMNFRGGNCRLTIDLNDHIGYRTYIRNQPFEHSVYNFGKQLKLGPNDVILDIGANIGTASIPICAENGCELIAIEASKPNAALLLQNAALNQVRIRPHILALTAPEDAGQFIPLYLRDGNRGANSLLKDWAPSAAGQHSEIVFTQTLDDLLSDEATIGRIKIVKIDVEGAEWAVLRGARNFLAHNRAPILMEYRFDAMDERLSKDFGHLLEFMVESYDVCGLDGHGQRVEFDPHGSYENIIFTRRPPRSKC